MTSGGHLLAKELAAFLVQANETAWVKVRCQTCIESLHHSSLQLKQTRSKHTTAELVAKVTSGGHLLAKELAAFLVQANNAAWVKVRC